MVISEKGQKGKKNKKSFCSFCPFCFQPYTNHSLNSHLKLSPGAARISGI
jgi:hypothetical protein